jgi:phosphoglycolate phosphatase-like HAD superfamily hydrolase
MFGAAPLLDLDGTLVHLDVDWPRLRGRLGVLSIAELWEGPADRWTLVTEAETSAALIGTPVLPVLKRLRRCLSFAVITSNSSAAALAFLDRYPDLARRCALVIGREQLGGPKDDRRRFKSAFDLCVSATATSRGVDPVVYVGNAGYELEFAAQLGARCCSVDDLIKEATAP